MTFPSVTRDVPGLRRWRIRDPLLSLAPLVQRGEVDGPSGGTVHLGHHHHPVAPAGGLRDLLDDPQGHIVVESRLNLLLPVQWHRGWRGHLAGPGVPADVDLQLWPLHLRQGCVGALVESRQCVSVEEPPLHVPNLCRGVGEWEDEGHRRGHGSREALATVHFDGRNRRDAALRAVPARRKSLLTMPRPLRALHER